MKERVYEDLKAVEGAIAQEMRKRAESAVVTSLDADVITKLAGALTIIETMLQAEDEEVSWR